MSILFNHVYIYIYIYICYWLLVSEGLEAWIGVWEPGFDPSFGKLICLATLMSSDRTKQICMWMTIYIYIYIYIVGLVHPLVWRMQSDQITFLRLIDMQNTSRTYYITFHLAYQLRKKKSSLKILLKNSKKSVFFFNKTFFGWQSRN